MQDAWNELASFEHQNVSALCDRSASELTKCAEPNEDGLPAVVTDLKKEITSLGAALNKKTYELYKLKKDLCHESTVMAKMADFEKEIHSLKQEKLKLSENLSEKIAELKDMHGTVSLLGEKIQLMKNESVECSKMLETNSKEVQSLKSRVLNQDQEIDALCMKNVTLSRSLEKKCEELRKLTSENSELKKENSESNNEIIKNNSDCLNSNTTEVLLNNSRLKEEMCSVKNNSSIPPNTLEAKIHGVKQLSENSTQWDEDCSLKSGGAKIAELHICEAENTKLKDEISPFSYEIISSESTKEKTAPKWRAVNKNATVKTVGEKITKEMTVTVKRPTADRCVLKCVDRLSNGLKERTELDRCTLKTETVSPSRTWTSENPHLRMPECTNQMMKVNLQEWKLNCLRKKVAWHKNLIRRLKKRELKLKTNVEHCKKIHFTFSVQLHMFSNVRFHSLYGVCAYNSETSLKQLFMSIVFPHPPDKRQEDILQCLKQENALQKHRILLLEVQAKHVNFVHKTHTNCLQSVSSLRIEVSLNLIISAIIVSHVELTLSKEWFVFTLV